MTQRLYYTDSYVTEFEASLAGISEDGKRIYLDRTAFYPSSGGQPFDLGWLGGVPVTDVVDEGDRIVHVLSDAVAIQAGPIQAKVDWGRRFDHMQQHTGQHLLSAVFLEELQAETVSFHLGAQSATIDLKIDALNPAAVQSVEQRANELVFKNLPVTVEFQDVREATDLRKASERQGLLRIVSIQGLDRSACGGTHVRSTAEIGPILIRKMDKVHGHIRVEFVCGARAVRRARADYDALSQISKAFSAPLDETPALLTALLERAAESDKSTRRLTAELSAARGRELYSRTPPSADGVHRTVLRLETITEEARTEAQGFCGEPQSVILVTGNNPVAILVAASKDSGFNAGQWLKSVISAAGGKGGGNAFLAQGSLPSGPLLETVVARFETGQ